MAGATARMSFHAASRHVDVHGGLSRNAVEAPNLHAALSVESGDIVTAR
ncbi:hypothetical protein [Herbaspirillum sp. RV1423]|nr:hypothetical protein [Herbaspirillum sp. RV1423]